MESGYPGLLSGIEICGKLFKNRLISTNSMPHYLQADEEHPERAVITHLVNRAKNGAAVVTMAGIFSKIGTKSFNPPLEVARKVGMREAAYFPTFDIYDPHHQNYFTQFLDEVHLYNCRANLALQFPFVMDEWGVNEDKERNIKAYTKEMIAKVIDSYVEQARIARDIGFDLASIHIAYGAPFGGSFISPLYNTRKDEYGGSLENRARVTLELLNAIKTRVGKDFILELVMSGKDLPGGNTVDDYCEFLKMADGLADIVQVRMGEVDANHPTGYTLDPNPALGYAERFKKLGLSMKIAPVGGFQDPEAAEKAITEGKADMICAARAFICEPDYIEKIREDRSNDITPCIRCNKCHAVSRKKLIRTACSVNPEYGLEHDLHNLVESPKRVKRVAVIGGGPAGMESAIRAANRGHEVTLFEKAPELGGQLISAAIPDFKWPVKKYLDYLLNQITKRKIDIRLNTEVTPDQINKMNFDAVLIAIGSEAITLNIPGAERALSAHQALRDPECIKGDVAVIGGGEVGLDVAMFLSCNGHKVTILEMNDELVPDSPPQHFRTIMLKSAEEEENLSWLLNVKATTINDKTVCFTDATGNENEISADTVVLAVGTKPRTKAALAFTSTAPEALVVGDCYEAGNILTAVRSAFGATVKL